MICPECKAEYRPGYTSCADCHVLLVNNSSQMAPSGEEPSEQLKTIWVGTDQSTCVYLCRELNRAEIPYEVAQNAKSRNMSMSATFRYELAVAETDEARAKELLELPHTLVEESDELEDEDEDPALLEYPDSGEAPTIERKRDSYLDPWYPEDATAEVWMQGASDNSNMVTMAFKENLIRVRVDVQDDGSKKFFVLPDDEVLAREIVREIKEDSPAE